MSAVLEVDLKRFRDGSEGVTKICYQQSTTSWVSADGLGCFHNITKTGGASDLQIGEAAFTAMALHSTMSKLDDEVVLGTDDGSVGIRKLDNLDHEVVSNIVRRNLAVTCLSYDMTGESIFVASKEPDILIYSKKAKNVVHKIQTYGVGVKTFDLACWGPYLALADENGSVKIVHLKVVDGVAVGDEKLATFGEICSKPYCRSKTAGLRLSWHPTKPYLAIPGLGGIVTIIAPDNASATGTSSDAPITAWKEMFVISTHDDINHDSADLTAVRFSPTGKYLISGDSHGTTLVWRVNEKDIKNTAPLKKVTTKGDVAGASICDVAFSPLNVNEVDNYIVVTTRDSYAYVDGVFENDKAIVASPAKPAVASPTKPSSFKRLQKNKSEKESDEEDFTDFTDGIASPKKAGVGGKKGAPSPKKVSTQESEMDEGGKSSSSASASGGGGGGRGRKDQRGDSRDDDMMNDDDSLISDDDNMTGGKAVIGKGGALSLATKDSVKTILKGLLEQGALTKPELQKPFQPASTQSDDRKRYLVWNNIGNIISISDSVSTRIEIRFADTTQEKISFTDDKLYTRASLSREGAVFASETLELDDMERIGMDEDEVEEKTKGSTIYYRAFSAKHIEGANSNFSFEMERGESATCVAVGSGWCAVTTSRNLLRIFSSTGLQIMVCFLKGPLLSISGSKTRLAVVYHGAASPLVDIYDISWKRNTVMTVVGALPMPLSMRSSPNTNLEWICFDVDSLNLCSMDSEGVVSMLVNTGSWFWIPILEVHRVRKSSDHIYWPIMIKGGKFIYIPLHGVTKPGIYPEPTKATHAFDFSTLKLTSGIAKEGKIWSKKNDKGLFANELHNTLYWESIKLKDSEQKIALSLFPPDTDMESVSSGYNDLKLNVDKKLCEAIDMACNEKKPERAMDLIHSLQSDNGFNLAILIGNKNNLPKVAELADFTKQLRHMEAAQAMGGDNYADSYDYQEMQQQQMQQQQQQQQQQQSQRANLREKRSVQEDAPTPQKRSNGVNSLTSIASAVTSASKSPATRSRLLDFDSNQAAAVPSQIPSHQYGSQDYPSYNSSSSNVYSSGEKSKPINPFAVSSVSSPVKKKSVLEGLQDMRGSPSPKKPLLRQSSFTMGAKSKKNESKNLL